MINYPAMYAGLAVLSADYLWLSIAWNGTVFCAVGRTPSYSAGAVMTSPDGVAWAMQAQPTGGMLAYDIAWNGTVFCAVGTNLASASRSFTSTNGVTWTPNTMANNARSNLAWNGTVFCSVGSGAVCQTSPDGVSWTARSASNNSNWTGIAALGSLFCMVSYSGTSFRGATSSDNGATWVGRAALAGTWSGIGAGGGTFVILPGYSTNAATTADGVTVTARTLPYSNSFENAAYGGTTFCAVTANYSFVSTDAGATWLRYAMPTGNWALSLIHI